MGVISQKKGKNMLKKGKIFENSIISVKNKMQFVFDLLVDTRKKQKKAVSQFVCVLEVELVFFLNKIITNQF